MAATASLVNHGPFQPVWTASRQLREGRNAPGRSSARRRVSNASLPSDYIDPARKELRSVLVRTHAVMHRTKAGQNYEKAVTAVNAEFWPPLKPPPGDWFPDVAQVYLCKRDIVDVEKVSHFCDILEQMPFLFKAMERIKISWLRNNYPLPLRIVRALERDDFELISSNFTGPISDINRYPGAMWVLTSDDSKKPRLQARQPSRDRRETKNYNRSLSRPFEKSALAHSLDPTCVTKSVVPHRREWNRLVHGYLDDCAVRGRPQRINQASSASAVTEGSSERSRAPFGRRQRSVVPPEEPLERPISRLMEPLYPPWQLVQQEERGDRRISDLGTVSADDAKLIMKRCRELKQTALSQMNEQYKAKIHKLEDNSQQRYRRKVSYLVPPYRTAGADMPAIRRRVQRRSQLEDVAMRSAAWFARLQQLGSSMGAADLPRCRQLFDLLRPYAIMEGSQTARGSEKLCLLLMSVPIYEALQSGLQMAVFYLHVHFLGGSENVFKRWIEARSLTDATKTSPLIAAFRGETSSEQDEADSLGDLSM